jgi:hypothetical protein
MSNPGSKKNHFYFWLIFFCFLFGAFFFFIQREWLIFRFNFGFIKSKELFNKQDLPLQQKVKMYYWKEDKLFFEEQTFVWFSDSSQTLKHLVNNWLSFLHQERLIDKGVSIENVLIDITKQRAYFSFDQTIFTHEFSIFDRCNLLECLSKTIKSSGINIKSIMFLVKNQIMDDDHIDFSESWPIDGFLHEY